MNHNPERLFLPMPTLSPALWETVEQHWRLGSQSVEALGRKYGVDQSTIHYHASKKGWPKRGSQRGDVELTLRANSADLWRELSESLARERGNDSPEDPAAARDRLATIRLWQRSMTVLREFQVSKMPAPGAGAANADPVLFTKADEKAVLARLDRLLAPRPAPPADPADPA